MGPGDTEVGPLDAHDDETNSMTGIVFDGLIGAIAGAVGTAAMTVVLFVAASLGAFDMTSLSMVVELTGIAAVVPGDPTAVGYVLFLAGGMVTWPLLFASVGRYLPGGSYAKQGAFFGFVLWTGFVLAFYDGYAGIALPLYVVFTFIAHLVYGFSLGAVFDYLGGREEPLV
ncbi:hypothetical protein HWV23_05200 [Natronomonas halophila]|uniref:DUF6789 family protein n=1 Tax=Natronomonas halophila TaxID=2747817 RepID=UPI0015B42D82|nr:DUF6789 family protein [Natronomonas halophila]QLD85143.1 hypothetical protein HWV23_05200 [Natronomonas halophila]